jgi:hypothetical protein
MLHRKRATPLEKVSYYIIFPRLVTRQESEQLIVLEFTTQRSLPPVFFAACWRLSIDGAQCRYLG